MKTRSVLIYGPQACGKTYNAERLRKHFGLARVVDEGMDCSRTLAKGPKLEPDGILYLAVECPTVAKLNGTIAIKYADAALLAKLPKRNTEQ